MQGVVHRAWERLPRGLRTPVSVVHRTFSLYMEDGCGTYAAAIAYYAIFSLVPLGLIILSIFGLVVDQQRIVKFVFDQIPLKETQSVQDSVNEIVSRAKQTSVAGLGFGLVALIWSGSGIFGAVRRGLSATSHQRKKRPYWRGKLVDFALIPSLGLLIVVSIAMTTIAQVVILKAGSLGPVPLDTNLALQVMSYVLPAVISFAMFTLLYRYVPSARPGWREAVTGAAFATVLFEVAKNLYATLIALTPYSKDTAIYAGFGTALAFLFWMFINASILLLGAEFGRALRWHPVAGQLTPEPAGLDETPAGPLPLENRNDRPAAEASRRAAHGGPR